MNFVKSLLIACTLLLLVVAPLHVEAQALPFSYVLTIDCIDPEDRLDDDGGSDLQAYVSLPSGRDANSTRLGHSRGRVCPNWRFTGENYYLDSEQAVYYKLGLRDYDGRRCSGIWPFRRCRDANDTVDVSPFSQRELWFAFFPNQCKLGLIGDYGLNTWYNGQYSGSMCTVFAVTGGRDTKRATITFKVQATRR